MRNLEHDAAAFTAHFGFTPHELKGGMNYGRKHNLKRYIRGCTMWHLFWKLNYEEKDIYNFFGIGYNGGRDNMDEIETSRKKHGRGAEVYVFSEKDFKWTPSDFEKYAYRSALKLS